MVRFVWLNWIWHVILSMTIEHKCCIDGNQSAPQKENLSKLSKLWWLLAFSNCVAISLWVCESLWNLRKVWKKKLFEIIITLNEQYIPTVSLCILMKENDFSPFHLGIVHCMCLLSDVNKIYSISAAAHGISRNGFLFNFSYFFASFRSFRAGKLRAYWIFDFFVADRRQTTMCAHTLESTVVFVFQFSPFATRESFVSSSPSPSMFFSFFFFYSISMST